MKLPHYTLKLPAEALWMAWITGLGALTTALLNALGVNQEVVVAGAAFVVVTARLITGAILPEEEN